MPNAKNKARRIRVAKPGPSYRLEADSIPIPQPGAYEVLIRVAACGVNRADLFQAEGNYPPPEGTLDTLGLEVAGEIAAIGSEVKLHRVGDKVCALLQGGGYAEYAVAREHEILSIPRGLSMEQAASLPEAFFTAWLNLFDFGRLAPEEWLLVHGGASGVGTASIQLGRAFGARVVATTGTAEKCAACIKLGAVRAVNYREEDFVGIVKELTEGQGIDLILDMVGGDYMQKNLAALACRGRLAIIAFLRGARTEVNFAPLLMKNITMFGSTLRSQLLEKKHELAQALRRHVWPLLESGEIMPVLDRVFPFEKAQEAHAYMQENRNIGKIVLVL